jgi:hypothetical protein
MGSKRLRSEDAEGQPFLFAVGPRKPRLFHCQRCRQSMEYLGLTSVGPAYRCVECGLGAIHSEKGPLWERFRSTGPI